MIGSLSDCRAGRAQESAPGEQEGRLPDNGRPRDQDPASAQPQEHREPAGDCDGQTGRDGFPQGTVFCRE